ncbi:MAG: GNAT family N-acetyltransferase [Rubrivivax sp.]|nr:GNAT family N-acetyltransferase [Rubrivivax sp.]
MPSPEIQIRRERPDQPDVMAMLGALDAYLASLYPPEANHILDVASLAGPDVRFFVAREGGAANEAAGGRIVGTGAVRLMAGEPATAGERYGEVKRMYVDPALRGRRLGAALIARIEAALHDEGITLALLETGREQAEALRLYTRAGYGERGPFNGYPDNGLSVFMGKRLVAAR